MRHGDVEHVSSILAGYAAAGRACVLLLLIAALLARDHRHAVAGRLGAMFALGAADYAVRSAPGLHSELRWCTTPIRALATGNNVVFWLFTQALLEHDFRYKWCIRALSKCRRDRARLWLFP
jgi:hypothetical protein